MRVTHCLYCGVMMTNLRRVQCGAPECKRRATSAWAAAWREQFREQAGTPYPEPYHKICETCGKPFKCREARTRFDSIACGNASESRRAAVAASRLAECGPRSQVVLYEGPSLRLLRAAERAEAARVLRPLRKCWYTGRCARCGDWFTHDQPQTVMCSPRCSKRQIKQRRRLRERMHGGTPGKVSRWRIFERDEWICQLCGLPVERGEKTPHPLAPTIDHIIPLVAWPFDEDAVHEDGNLQCAHFLCNSIKGDRIAV